MARVKKSASRRPARSTRTAAPARRRATTSRVTRRSGASKSRGSIVRVVLEQPRPAPVFNDHGKLTVPVVPGKAKF